MPVIAETGRTGHQNRPPRSVETIRRLRRQRHSNVRFPSLHPPSFTLSHQTLQHHHHPYHPQRLTRHDSSTLIHSTDRSGLFEKEGEPCKFNQIPEPEAHHAPESSRGSSIPCTYGLFWVVKINMRFVSRFTKPFPYILRHSNIYLYSLHSCNKWFWL